MPRPPQRLLPHPWRRVALDHPQRVEAEDQLGVTKEGVARSAGFARLRLPSHQLIRPVPLNYIRLCVWRNALFKSLAHEKTPRPG